jgi:hypothetical protein
MQEMKISFYLLQLHRLGSLPRSNSEFISEKMGFLDIWQESLRRGLNNRKASTYTKQHKPEIIADKYPCLRWDSNSRFHC